MLAGELYTANAPEIQADQAAARAWMARFNGAIDMPLSERYELLRERLATIGTDSMIRPPFHCDLWLQHQSGRGGVPQLQLHHP